MSSLSFESPITGNHEPAVLPVPYEALKQKLELFADFDEPMLEVIDNARVFTLPKQHPVRALLTLQGRPMPMRTLAQTEVLRHRKAYRAGVLVAAALLMRREAVVFGDVERSLRLNNSQIVLRDIRQTAAAGLRYPVSQFVATENDVRSDFQAITEQSWLRKHVSFLRGNEHERGHNDYVLIGAGDTLAEYAMRDMGLSADSLQTERLA